jgi:hypothetical protein
MTDMEDRKEKIERAREDLRMMDELVCERDWSVVGGIVGRDGRWFSTSQCCVSPVPLSDDARRDVQRMLDELPQTPRNSYSITISGGLEDDLIRRFSNYSGLND